MTVAEQADGKILEDFIPTGTVRYNPHNLIFTFEDGSMAKAITSYRKCKPYQTQSLSTLSIEPYKVWKKV